MTRKPFVFVIVLIVAIFAASCGLAIVPTETQIEAQTGATMEDIDPTQVPEPKESVYDTYWVERYEGAKVTIEKVESFGENFKITLKTLHGATFSYYEWDAVGIYQSINEGGLTIGKGKYFTGYNDDDHKEFSSYIKTVSGKVWVYKIGAISQNGLISSTFVEVYKPTEKDTKLESLLRQVIPNNTFRYPSDGVEDLLRSYSEWGTKEGLDDFLKLINHPRSTDLYYSIIDEELKSLPTTGLDVTLLGKVEDFGEFQVMIYKKNMIPDVFRSKIQDFPVKLILENYEFEFIPFSNSYEISSGTVFRFSGRELIVPKGSILVIMKTTSQQCECWSPLIINQVLGIYR